MYGTHNELKEPFVPQLSLTSENLEAHNNNSTAFAFGKKIRSSRQSTRRSKKKKLPLLTTRSKATSKPNNLPPLPTIKNNHHNHHHHNNTTSRSSIRGLMTKRSHISLSSSTARLQRTNLNAMDMRTSRSTPNLKPYVHGSPGNTLINSLPLAGSLLITDQQRHDLLVELTATNERMNELMAQKQAALVRTLARTNRMLHKKIKHSATNTKWDHPLSARNKARAALQRIENPANLPPNSVPFVNTTKYGWRTNQDSSGACMGMGKGLSDGMKGSYFESTAQYQQRFSGVSNTARSRIKAVDQRKIMRNPLPQSEFKDFVEKAIRLGIDLRTVGHC